MRDMKKLLSIVLALVLASGGGVAFAEGTPVLTVAIADRTNVEDYNTNQTTLFIEETLGVDLQFTIYSSEDYNTRINLNVISGEPLEDIIFGSFGNGMIMDWVEAGAIVPLTEYYADPEIAPNITESFERLGYDYRGMITMSAGEIYYLPSLNASYYNENPSKAWMYTPWLEQIGSETPETTEELREVLLQIVSTDLNGNGKSDEIGILGFDGVYSQWFSWLMNSFISTSYQKNYMHVEDGVVSFAYTQDAFRDGVEYIRSLFADNLIATESLTQDQSSYTNMLNTEDYCAFLPMYSAMYDMLDPAIQENYHALAPVAGPEGVRYADYVPSTPGCGMVITVDCENPELAFRVGDLMCSETLSIATRFGWEGQDWDYVRNVENAEDYVGLFEKFGAYIVVYDDATFWSGAMQNRAYMQSGPMARDYQAAAGMAYTPETITQFNQNLADGAALYQEGGFRPDEYISVLNYTAEEQEVIDEVQAQVEILVEETIANWLMGNEELNDDTWNAFQQSLVEFGLNDWLACAQAAYDRSMES